MSVTNNDYTQIDLLLREELKKCHAPVTGYCVVSAIVTEKDTYIEHNHEEVGSVTFQHAEIRVLEKILRSEEKPVIKKIFMLGGGVIKKIKYYTPCYTCTVKLKSYVTPETIVIILPLQDSNGHITFTFEELFESYADAPYSKFQSTGLSGIKKELIEKTILKEEDVKFMADLILMGLEKGIKLYLTGSSTGRGGVSRLLMSKTSTSYGDIDIIVVTKDSCLKITEYIEKIIAKHYGKFVKNERVVPVHQNTKDVVLGKVYYMCGENGDKLIDFTFSTDFKGSLSYHAYELKNWFHQLL